MNNKKALMIVAAIVLSMVLVAGLLFYEVFSLVKDVNIDTSDISFDFPDISDIFGDDQEADSEEDFDSKFPALAGNASYSINNVTYYINENFESQEVEQSNGSTGYQYVFIDDDGNETGVTMEVGLYQENDLDLKVIDYDDIDLDVYNELLENYSFSETDTYTTNDCHFYLLSGTADYVESDATALVMYCYDSNHMIYLHFNYTVDNGEDYFNNEHDDYFYDFMDSIEVE